MEIYKSRTDKALIDWQWYEPSLRNITHLILKNIPRTRGRVLDVGCGTGRVSFAIARQGYEVTGIDIEKRVIDIASKIQGLSSCNPNFKVLDFCDPEMVLSEFYDIVVCSEVLEHIKNYHCIIDNIFKTLKKGGYVIITVPYDPDKWSVLDEYGGHVRRFTISEIKNDLSQFFRIKIYITGFPFYRMLVRAYLIKIKISKQTHSNETLWNSHFMKWIAKFLYFFMRIDNLFAFTRWGDALIVVAQKPESLDPIY
jgi:SAM-dependent methyltransferase